MGLFMRPRAKRPIAPLNGGLSVGSKKLRRENVRVDAFRHALPSPSLSDLWDLGHPQGFLGVSSKILYRLFPCFSESIPIWSNEREGRA